MNAEQQPSELHLVAEHARTTIALLADLTVIWSRALQRYRRSPAARAGNNAPPPTTRRRLLGWFAAP